MPRLPFDEIRSDRYRNNSEWACTLLRKVAIMVAPLMKQRKWRVKVLAELSPHEVNTLGWNIGAGQQIFLYLRNSRAKEENAFFSIEVVVDLMLHELTHCQCGSHDEKFQKLYHELHREFSKLSTLDPPSYPGLARKFHVQLGGFDYDGPSCRTDVPAGQVVPMRQHEGSARESNRTSTSYQQSKRTSTTEPHYGSSQHAFTSNRASSSRYETIPQLASSSRQESSSRPKSSARRGVFTRAKSSSGDKRFSKFVFGDKVQVEFR